MTNQHGDPRDEFDPAPDAPFETGDASVTEADIRLQFQIPGFPYSVVSASLPVGATVERQRGLIVDMVGMAYALQQELNEAFPREQEPSPPPPSNQSYGGGQQYPARGQQRPAPQQQRRNGPAQQPIAYCPQHGGAPVFLSPPQYNRDGDSCFHPLERPEMGRNGKMSNNHGLYWRETVDEYGESNAGVPLPVTSEPIGGGGYRR